MRNSADPARHRQAERQFIEHVERLLDDDRLRVDTTRGRRSLAGMLRRVVRTDHSVDLKRAMSELNVTDRDLQAAMPVGEQLDVELAQKKLLLFREVVGRMRILCVSPTKALLRGQAPEPLSKADVDRLLAQFPPAPKGVPTTVVILSTSGFTIEAHEAGERRADRTTILIEPNVAGGFGVYGPAEMRNICELFDPEAEEEKRRRVREAIEQSQDELSGSGVAADRVVSRTHLPLQLVEAELKSYARQGGLVAKRLDGRFVLFREGSVPANASSGGGDMPMIDRIKLLFARKGETERKIAFLSERRAALGQQRDRAYEQIESQEKKDADLRQQFKAAASELAKRRITSQLLQLRKEMERRQQLLAVLNQQMNVIGTDLHNLELVQQGKVAQLPNSEQIAENAAAAEEMLAQLEANTELAAGAASVATTLGMSTEEQALYEELQREAGLASSPADMVPTPLPHMASPAGATAMPSGQAIRPPAVPQHGDSRPNEPEAG